MGIRDAEAVDALAAAAGFALVDDVALPANNRCRVRRRGHGCIGAYTPRLHAAAEPGTKTA